MAHGEKSGKSTLADQRRKRQAAALRANLRKRKEQARGRAQSDATDDGVDAPERVNKA